MAELKQYSGVPAKVGGTGLSLRDIVFILFRRRWVVLLISMPIILMGGFSLLRQTSSFSASCRVLVELSSVDLPRWNTTGRNIDYDRELSTMFNIAMSLPVAEMAAASLTDSVPRIMELLPNNLTLRQPDGLKEFLLEQLDVSAVGESNILEFQFSSPNLEVSLMAVGAMRDAFVEYHVKGRKNRKAIAFYNEQYRAVQSQIDSLLSARSTVLAASGYSSIKDQMRNEVGLLADIEARLLTTTANRRELELQYQTLSGYLDGDPLAFPLGVDANKNYTLVELRTLVSKHQDELNLILTVHTPESIPARRHQTLVDRSLEGLRETQASFVESIRLEYEAAQSRERTLAEQAATLTVSTARGPVAESKITMVDVEIESLRELLKDVQGKLGEVRLNQTADERVSSVTRLTDPEGIYSLSGGKTVIYFVVIAVFALALGIVAALILASMDHRVYHPRDVEDKLRLPVFASVSRTD
jgi:uncharacterized protein involved in exopolysaccharide biosynthesis